MYISIQQLPSSRPSSFHDIRACPSDSKDPMRYKRTTRQVAFDIAASTDELTFIRGLGPVPVCALFSYPQAVPFFSFSAAML